MFLKDSEVGNCKVTEKIRSLAQFVHCLQSDPIYVEEKAALTEIRNLWEGFQRQIVTPTFQWCQYKLPPTNKTPTEKLQTTRQESKTLICTLFLKTEYKSSS
ncbi:hypothetical protein CSKR_112803 [Clonorchis sinensis]|uniref:Uncharacterized protein n=1 Tax=Clonorchis sinensis TaxID=79923 RepID=A0A3R7EQ53_CLOSI|nr:hypothetical protein CSKR_112803 [Clonorchis sinensis]